MPVADPKLPPAPPPPLSENEAAFIKATIARFYGKGAVVRSFGNDPSRIDIHVEADSSDQMMRFDCLGILVTRIERTIGLTVTKRGSWRVGKAKLAYRQGVII